MKERPILFSAPMVRALLAGTKTQTRRVVKPQPEPMPGGGVRWPKHGHSGSDEYLRDVAARMWCPYGRPGDRLWVRETHEFLGGPSDLRVLYRADGAELPASNDRDYMPKLFRGRPSIHMPRWASRITLEITAVRVERLQEISEEDAVAEGAPSGDLASGRECIFPNQGLHRWGFRLIWEQINGPGSWDVNPWVWVLQFRRLGVE